MANNKENSVFFMIVKDVIVDKKEIGGEPFFVKMDKIGKKSGFRNDDLDGFDHNPRFIGELEPVKPRS